MDPRDWERQRLHKCLQGDGVRGRVGMQVPEAQTRMLHRARCHCHQICPNKLWSPRISSRPALPPLSSPTVGLPVVQSGQGPACQGAQTEPSLAPERRLLRTEDYSPQPPSPSAQKVTGRAAKAVSAGRWQLLSVTAALLAAAPAVHGGQCVLLGWDPLNQGSPQAAAACCFLPSFSSLPLRRNGIWREGGKEEREGKGRREG